MKRIAGISRIVAAATLAAVLSMAACGGGEKGAAGGPQRVSFESFAAYLESADTRSAHQVVFIGIDGASWRILDPLIEQGMLPNLARIMKEGAYGTLLSTPCHVSPPGWASMHSGYSPAKTGVHTFGKFDWDTREFLAVNATDVRVPSVWDVASQANRKVAVTNVPLTFPVRPVNGIMVSGLLTPVPLVDRVSLGEPRFATGLDLIDVAPDVVSFSPVVKTEGADSLNTVVWWRVDTTNDNRENYDRVILAMLPRLDSRPADVSSRVYSFPIGEYSPWMQVCAVWRGEVRDGWFKLMLKRRVDGRFQAFSSQVLFDVRETGVQYTHPEALADELAGEFGYYMPSKFLKREVVPAVTDEAAKYAGYFYDYDDWDLFYYVFTQTDNIQHLEGFSEAAAEVYSKIDRFIGELVRKMPKESTLIIASDHGFRKFDLGIDLNEFLEGLGLLDRLSGGDDIDYDRTIAFHNMWHVYFNEDLLTAENLAARGVEVAKGESARDALTRYIGSREIVSTGGTKRFSLEFTPVEGRVDKNDPHLVVEGAYDGYMVEFWNLKRPRGGVVWPLRASEAHNHEREGVFLVWGNHVNSGYDAGVKNIEDIAPTTLYLLGLPVAADMDGRVMFDILHRKFVAATPQYELGDYNEITREFIAVEQETEPLEKKLRALGYIQ